MSWRKAHIDATFSLWHGPSVPWRVSQRLSSFFGIVLALAEVKNCRLKNPSYAELQRPFPDLARIQAPFEFGTNVGLCYSAVGSRLFRSSQHLPLCRTFCAPAHRWRAIYEFTLLVACRSWMGHSRHRLFVLAGLGASFVQSEEVGTDGLTIRKFKRIPLSV